jgi:hypothetical protein
VVQTRGNGAARDPEDIGDVVDRQSGHVPEHEDGAVVGADRFERSIDLVTRGDID